MSHLITPYKNVVQSLHPLYLSRGPFSHVQFMLNHICSVVCQVICSKSSPTTWNFCHCGTPSSNALHQYNTYILCITFKVLHTIRETWSQRVTGMQALTSSLRRISSRRGRDMDHWLRQFSNIIIFITEESICWRISGWSSRIRRNGVLSEGDTGPFVLLSFLKRKARIWSNVLQQPVHTIASEQRFMCGNSGELCGGGANERF